jgi:hypothetical protein
MLVFRNTPADIFLPSMLTRKRGAMKFASTILSLLLMLVVGGQCGAAENDELSNQYVRTIYDWEITITARKLDHFLAYTGSKLAPVYDLTASYQNFSQAYAGPSAPIKYRQFLCGAFRVLGCKTYNALNLAPVTQGIIRVCDDSGAANNCPWGVSSVIARLLYCRSRSAQSDCR